MKTLIRKFIITFLLFNNSLVIKTSDSGSRQMYPPKLSYRQGKEIEQLDDKIVYAPSNPASSWRKATVYKNGVVIYIISGGKLTYFSNGSSKIEFID